MDSIKSLEFGHLIAFLLPGLVAARAEAYYFGMLRAALDAVAGAKEGVFGPLSVLLVVGAATGLAISVCRQQWLDPLHGVIYGLLKDNHPSEKDGRGKPCKVPRPAWRPNYSVLRDSKDRREFFERAVEQVYRYYQFIGNMAVAMTLLFVARGERYAFTEPITIGVGVTAVVFEVTAYQQFKGWCRVHNQITGAAGTPAVATTASAPAPTAPAATSNTAAATGGATPS